MSHIRYEVRDRIAHVVIDRPEKRNAMTYGILRDFYAAVQRAGTDEGVGAVIIEGTGGAFCAGTDLSDLNDTPEGERGVRGVPSVEGERPPPFLIASCPRPVIGAIDGPAVGMGAEFATQCDVRIASTRARFGWVFVLRGLVADTGAGTFLLPRIVGPSEAMRLLLSGEIIDAATALELGFVSAVVEPDDLPAAAEEEAKRYLAGSPFAISRMKRLVYGGMFNDIPEHARQTAALLAECFGSKDHAEGVAAFLERRPANFTGQ
jgi:2-(1,2-epoxy-1,2-dihydrophenyl)acetyl-CoA isomerase